MTKLLLSDDPTSVAYFIADGPEAKSGVTALSWCRGSIGGGPILLVVEKPAICIIGPQEKEIVVKGICFARLRGGFESQFHVWDDEEAEAAKERKVIAEIKKLGGKFTLANGFVIKVNLANTAVTDAGLAHLKGLTNLQSLFLWGANVTDAGLEHLKGLTNLQSLNLSHTKITDAGLEHLKGLTNLQSLYLSNTQVTDDLQSPYLSNTKITDAGLEHLKGLTKLQWLHLGYTQVTDAGVEDLERALPNVHIYH
jgi:hypothetical protein